eukprot:94606-Chlamydomonas_euryale.AAC.1
MTLPCPDAHHLNFTHLCARVHAPSRQLHVQDALVHRHGVPPGRRPLQPFAGVWCARRGCCEAVHRGGGACTGVLPQPAHHTPVG